MMDKTKLDTNNPHHQLLMGAMANFITDYGYTTRELYSLIDHTKNQLWSALVEIEKKNRQW